jgi:hypothetical protein
VIVDYRFRRSCTPSGAESARLLGEAIEPGRGEPSWPPPSDHTRRHTARRWSLVIAHHNTRTSSGAHVARDTRREERLTNTTKTEEVSK